MIVTNKHSLSPKNYTRHRAQESKAARGDVGRELGHLMSPQEAELDWYAILNSFAITMLSNSSTFVHYCAFTNA